jgi:type II secretory pathway component PulF
MSNNNIFIINDLGRKGNALQASIVFLLVFLILTIIIFNIYKGTKIALPNLQQELREISHFHLLKSMGWALTITLIIIYGLLYKKPHLKYVVNKAIKI